MLFPEIARQKKRLYREIDLRNAYLCTKRNPVREVLCEMWNLRWSSRGREGRGKVYPRRAMCARTCVYIYICIFILVSSADGWFITQWLRPRYRGPLRNQFQIAAGEDRWKREACWDGEARWIILPQPGLTEQRANLEIMQYRAETLGILKTCTIIASLKTYVAINAYSSSSPRMF